MIEWLPHYAIAFYLYLRPGERRALTLGDIDLGARVVHVTTAYDEKAAELTVPKTSNGVRDVPTPETLVPLLKHLRDAATDLSPPVAALPALHCEQRQATILREHLDDASVTPTRLNESTASAMPINFRSWRDSGITWRALAGGDLARIQRRAGHDRVSTPLGCVKQAEDLSGKAEAPFGPLPNSVLAQRLGQRCKLPRRNTEILVPKEGVALSCTEHRAVRERQTTDLGFFL